MAKEDEGCTGWDTFNPMCHAEDHLGDLVEGAIGDLADAVMEGFGKVVTSLGTMWIHVGTPQMTSNGSDSSPVEAGERPDGAASIDQILDWSLWISLCLVGMAIIFLGIQVAARMRRGEAAMVLDKFGIVAAAAILLGAAGSIVSGFLGNSTGLLNNSGGTVLFLQSATWWIVGIMAVLSLIVGATKMAWEQRMEPGKNVIEAFVTLLVVAGAGTTAIATLVTASDAYSVWVINASLECDVTTDQACFGENISLLLALTSAAPSGLGVILIILLGLLAILGSIFQIGLMVVRSAMLVIGAGLLPAAASFTNTATGKQWFSKLVGWLLAFILYKPAAATVYAAAFHLTGTDVFQDDGSGLYSVTTGLLLMGLALVALPVLMKFCTPMVGALAAGAGGGAMIAALSALPSGAGAVGQLMNGDGSASGGDAPSGASESSGSSPGPSGGSGPEGADATGESGSSGSVGAKGSAGDGAASEAGGAEAGGGSSGAGAGSSGGGVASCTAHRR